MHCDDDIFEECKGAFTEQFVFEQIHTLKDVSCYYFSADDSKQELDFLLQEHGRIIPVEVKAEENLRAKSLRQFVIEHKETHGVRLSMSPYRRQDWMTNLPKSAPPQEASASEDGALVRISAHINRTVSAGNCSNRLPHHLCGCRLTFLSTPPKQFCTFALPVPRQFDYL